MKRIVCVVGTRPEAIKMAPLIQRLRSMEGGLTTTVLLTAQHREMVASVFEVFGIEADISLDIMEHNQSLSGIASKVLSGIDRHLEELKPSMMIVQGDTTTVMSAALAAFHRQVPIAHVEAGLRTKNLYLPFPEEMNRRVVSRVADLHFAPTTESYHNLVAEGVPVEAIHQVGNTGIDALLQIASRLPPYSSPMKRLLVTCHRRENLGENAENIFLALKKIAATNPDYTIRYPVHPNPKIKDAAYKALGAVNNINLLPPLDYVQFVTEMVAADFILTDSGGVQEEAPALGKPVLVMRDETERPEAVAMGLSLLVGSDTHKIVDQAQRLIVDRQHYASMAQGNSPFGDGNSSERIVAVVKQFLSQEHC